MVGGLGGMPTGSRRATRIKQTTLRFGAPLQNPIQCNPKTPRPRSMPLKTAQLPSQNHKWTKQPYLPPPVGAARVLVYLRNVTPDLRQFLGYWSERRHPHPSEETRQMVYLRGTCRFRLSRQHFCVPKDEKLDVIQASIQNVCRFKISVKEGWLSQESIQNLRTFLPQEMHSN